MCHVVTLVTREGLQLTQAAPRPKYQILIIGNEVRILSLNIRHATITSLMMANTGITPNWAPPPRSLIKDYTREQRIFVLGQMVH